MSPLRVAVLGTTVDVTAPDPVRGDLEGSLADLAPVADADARPPDRTLTLQATAGGYDLLDGTDVVRAGIDPSVAAATVVWHLNTIATRTSPHLILHAAAVAAPGGGVVVLAGGSGAGKSTLAAACLAAGLQYLTDELVAIDLEAGLIVPYPKPLSLEHQPLVPARSLGRVVADPRPPAGVVFPVYRSGVEPAQVPLSVGWCLLALAAHSPNLATHGAAAVGMLTALALACPAVQVTHGDARQIVTSIEAVAQEGGRPLRPAASLPAVTAWTTTVPVGDDLAVFDHATGRLHLLNSTAAQVWRAAAAVSDPREVVDAVLAADDPPGDAALVRATADRLVAAGLLAASGPAR